MLFLDDMFLDECCLLPSQVLIPHLQYSPPRTSLTSPLLPHLNLPLNFEYGKEYEQLKFTNHEIPYIEGCLTCE